MLCKHYHTRQAHPQCLRERERVGFIDIESSALDANYGILLTYCILDNDSNKLYFDTINKADIKKWGKTAQEDTRLLRSLMRDMAQFDRLVGHYSSRFDLPMIRTRALMCGLSFFDFGDIVQTDTWMILRKKFKLSRNSLENGVRSLTGKTQKNHLTLASKHGCLRGEKKAIEFTLDHNRKDVSDTRALWRAINSYAKQNKSSI